MSRKAFLVTYTATFTRVVHADSEREAALAEAADNYARQDLSPGLRGMEFVPGSIQTVRIVPRETAERPGTEPPGECDCPRSGMGARTHFCGKGWMAQLREAGRDTEGR